VPRLAATALVLAFVAAARPAAAQAAAPPAATPDAPRIDLGTEIFTGYSFVQSPKTTDAANNVISPNAFDVGRAYVDVAGQVSRAVAFRVTEDITREGDTTSSLSGSLAYRLKYGYAQLNLDNGHAVWTESWVRVGIQPTPFVGYEEEIYRYRFQGTTFTDRVGALVDSDAGVSFHTALPGGRGDIHAGVYNGEGFASEEANNEKSMQVRATLRPFSGGGEALRGLRLTVFVDADRYVRAATRNRYVVDATYESAHFNAGADYLVQRDRPLPDAPLAKHDGWSVWLTPFFREKGHGPEALLRFDDYTLRRDDRAIRRRVIAGFAWWFPAVTGRPHAAMLVDFDQLTFTNFAPIPANADQRTIAVHMLIDYE